MLSKVNNVCLVAFVTFLNSSEVLNEPCGIFSELLPTYFSFRCSI